MKKQPGCNSASHYGRQCANTGEEAPACTRHHCSQSCQSMLHSPCCTHTSTQPAGSILASQGIASPASGALRSIDQDRRSQQEDGDLSAAGNGFNAAGNNLPGFSASGSQDRGRWPCLTMEVVSWLQVIKG